MTSLVLETDEKNFVKFLTARLTPTGYHEFSNDTEIMLRGKWLRKYFMDEKKSFRCLAPDGLSTGVTRD